MSVYFCRQFLLSIRRLLYVFFVFYAISDYLFTCYLNEWKHFCRQFLLSIRRLLFIFCILRHFDFFNVFLCWIATVKKEVKKPFLGVRVWAPKPVYRAPKRPEYVTEKSHMVCLNRPYHFKLLKGCLPQILLGSFLNALSYTSLLKQTLLGWASDNERVARWLVKLRFPCRTETQSLRLPEHRRQYKYAFLRPHRMFCN